MNKLFHIPIYDCQVRLVVAKNIERERKKYDHLFGESNLTDCDALCSSSGGHNFALFFSTKASRNMEVIAHEVFHLTHRILDWTNSNFDKEHHEQGALLHGYLMNLVVKALPK